MGFVADTLIDLLRSQVEAHGTVVWYDPEKAYSEVAQSLSPEGLAGAAVQRYDPERGFIWLRRQLEPLWAERTDPPRLLIYAPLAQGETRNALIEFEVAGAVMRPGQQPPERNTALAVVAHRALQAVFPPAALEDIVAQVEAGQLSLADLDQLAEKGAEAQTGAVAIIFGSGNVSEVALQFLAKTEFDREIEERQALGGLAGMLSDALGVHLPADEGVAALRAQLARQMLVTDLVQALADDLPQSLRTFPVAARPVARQAAVDLAQAWRNRRDLARSYVYWAKQVQGEIGTSSLRLRTEGPRSGQALDLSLDALARAETFAANEVCLQQKVEAALARRASLPLVELAEVRLGGFWAAQQPEIKARWNVVADAGRVLVEAARVESALKGKKWSAGALFSGYALGDQPWCELDTAQRHLERDFHRFELDVLQHESLIQLVAQARRRYAAVSDCLADLFAHALAADRFELPGALLQADVYREVVAPAAKNGPVAYILVDALRLEMARELSTILAGERLPPPRGGRAGEGAWKLDLTPALATPPTVTEIGMAALLPGAERGLTVIPAEGNRLAAVVAGGTLKTRQDRLAHLEAAVEGDVVATRLDQLAPLSDVALSQAIRSADVVVVTATEEVDGLCENNPALARRMLDDVLNQLRRAIKTLFALGIETIVISADHGYLFGEKLSTGESIDAPGGQTATLKRRVWIGQGGAETPAFLRAPLSAFGIGGELEIATPWNLSCFKVKGGAMEYFHGGLSLPELVVPVLTVRPAVARAPAAAARLQWTLTLGSRAISTRFLSVTVEGRSEELLPIEPPAIRVQVQAGDQPISVPVSASYGFQEVTRDVQLALNDKEPRELGKNTITLMITETPSVGEVTVHLLDGTTGISLARLDHVPFSITM